MDVENLVSCKDKQYISGLNVMKIDWKHVASTEGYKSLKAQMHTDVANIDLMRQRSRSKNLDHYPMREKKKFQDLFNWVICRAKHYAHHYDRPIEDILTEWEKNRDYWWVGYYNDRNMPRFRTANNNVRPQGYRGYVKSIKKAYSHRLLSPTERARVVRELSLSYRRHQMMSERRKTRWSKERKEKVRRLKNL